MERIKQEDIKNIVIVGGSHSGFSSAWMMLHGPATFCKNNSLGPSASKFKSFPDAPLKQMKDCLECCTCDKTKKKKEIQCGCICKCFGYFTYKDWDFDYDNDLPFFAEGSIKILYRDKIRVFYGTVTQAKQAGYTEFSDQIFKNPNGFVYSYTGLRGDAKRLYNSIKKGDEKRVQLVKAATIEEQAKYLEKADLIIMACGFQTNKIPIKDGEGRTIDLSQRVSNTQFDVDGKCRVCCADGSLLTKTFGSGIAYPTRTNDGMSCSDHGKPDPRADSFSLYCNWVGNRILMNLMPKSLLENKLHKTMRNNRKKAIQNNPNNNNNQSSPKKQSSAQKVNP